MRVGFGGKRRGEKSENNRRSTVGFQMRKEEGVEEMEEEKGEAGGWRRKKVLVEGRILCIVTDGTIDHYFT